MLFWVFLGWVSLLMGTTWGQETCGCTVDTLPHPRIVLLGPTGVGKSTFGNRLFNISQSNQNEALCSQSEWTTDENGEYVYSPHRFSVGHGTEAVTTNISWMVGHYLGDPANPCITVIDTPGTGDTKGRDCEHGIALTEEIKQMGSIDAFVFLYKGTSPRFTQSMEDQIKLYMSIFGQEMWQNTITEFTFWRHDRRSIHYRERNRGSLNEVTQHTRWNKEYRERFEVSQSIPSIFIDPVYDEEYADINEKEINEKNTDKLWNLLTNDLTTFQCDKRCQAPSGFFEGQPWLVPENVLQNKRQRDRSVITWQIWFAGCTSSGTQDYKIWQVAADNTSQVVYEEFGNNTVKKNQSKLLGGMHVLDEAGENFRTIKLVIELTEDHHYGSYFIENEKGRSDLGQLKKTVDGEWQEWSHFGPCSKTCITGFEKPGLMQRNRTCKPPQNGGHPCQGKSTDESPCAHQPGDDEAKFRQCPIDASWSKWPSEWSFCSSNCKKSGEPVPQKSRSRTCILEAYGGKNCSFLEEQARMNQLPLYKEERACSELSDCPRPAAMGSWGEWSACAQTCFSVDQPMPQIERNRSCTEAILSTDETLNFGVATCNQLGEIKMFMNCNIAACPIDATWSSWSSEWSLCSGNCKKRGEPVPQKSRLRTCIPEAFGGNNCSFLEDQAIENNQPLYREEQACSELPDCPRPATLGSWGAWSSCTQTCYPQGQPIPQIERKRSCTEAILSTDETLNADVGTCSQLGEVKMYKNCQIGTCPGVELRPLRASLSSILNNTEFFGAAKCIDGNTEGHESFIERWKEGAASFIETAGSPESADLCHTQKEPTPWIAIDYGTTVTVERVEIFNRRGCCGYRTQNVDVRISDELPTSGRQMFSGGTLLGRFVGPASHGQHIIISGQAMSGRYVIVQMDNSYNALNLKEVKAFGESGVGH